MEYLVSIRIFRIIHICTHINYYYHCYRHPHYYFTSNKKYTLNSSKLRDFRHFPYHLAISSYMRDYYWPVFAHTNTTFCFKNTENVTYFLGAFPLWFTYVYV